jgi:glucosamine-6-phosphate deaminase
MNSNLFDHINIDKANTYVAKGTGDVEANLKEFNAILDRTDIEIQVLGVGPDGHLGFNEPGDTLYDGAHEETLEESTIEANKRFFDSADDVPRYAVSLGIGSIMQARQVLLIATGADKAEAVRQALEGDVSPQWQASILRAHPDVVFLLDEDAASLLTRR